MLKVTSLATEKLNEYMAQNKLTSALRISLMNGGCSGRVLGLSLDEFKPGDATFEEGGLSFVVERSLFEMCGTISLDYVDSPTSQGFSLSPEKPISGGGCSSCGSGSCG